jgi:amino acid adenylation domain-containing protein
VATTLTDLFAAAVRLHPERIALESGRAEITYRELDLLSSVVRDRLHELGVRPGDRVGVCLPKSIDAVAALLGIMKTGAAYVPVDPAAPGWRCGYILSDCSVRLALVEETRADELQAEVANLGEVPIMVRLGEVGDGSALALAVSGDTPSTESCRVEPDDLAYILYTSGSTGKPKGVMLSHRNATSFVNWCSEILGPTAEDRFSSHAPLHFDLSILDLYVPLMHGALVVLIGAEAGKDPIGLAQLIAERRITVWYSTPAILSMLVQFGKLERHRYDELRTVLFAGEVFAVKHLRALQEKWPAPRYCNLYGPTETNVCTWYEVAERVPPTRAEPYPIGRACSHLRTRVVAENGTTLPPGVEGELCVSGPGVMRGYWNQPELTARAFHVDAAGNRWYRTGDIVLEAADGDYTFVGRRDRMVKRRGYRIELGEIEAGLYRHRAVREAAVVAASDTEGGVRITAHLSFREGQQPSLIELKAFCAGALPIYMVPDRFQAHGELPRTSTDKVDYQRLLRHA